MKYLIPIIALILSLSGTCLADEYFTARTLSELRVAQANPQDNSAVIRDSAGDSATVRTGDAIGRPGAMVVKITELYILVQTEEGTTKMPVRRVSQIGENRIGLH